MPGVEHGTNSAYQKCKRRSEGSCEPCKAAHREYMAVRRRDPIARNVEIQQECARRRALWRLAKHEPALFRALYEEELQRGETA